MSAHHEQQAVEFPIMQLAASVAWLVSRLLNRQRETTTHVLGDLLEAVGSILDDARKEAEFKRELEDALDKLAVQNPAALFN